MTMQSEVMGLHMMSKFYREPAYLISPPNSDSRYRETTIFLGARLLRHFQSLGLKAYYSIGMRDLHNFADRMLKSETNNTHEKR